MGGETDLTTLLASLRPTLGEPEYVFCTLTGAPYGAYAELQPFAAIQEEEGLTLVLEKRHAEASSLDYEGTFRCITLKVYSSLEAVGLTRAVSAALAERGIPANLLAGYHHDHVLVPSSRAEEALKLLRELS